MRKLAVVLAMVAMSAACREADRNAGAADNERVGADTMIESETIKDTTIVTADTSIDVDTVKETDNIEGTRE